MRLINADALKESILAERDKIPLKVPAAPYELCAEKDNQHGNAMRGGIRIALRCMENTPTIEAVPVVRCRDCVYFRERHVRLADGTERDYATGEEWFAATVGINVGSQCRREEEPCFRDGGDFCSRGVRKEKRNAQTD